MKIAVISDIHGNIDALNAVMDDIKANLCEKTFVLGDYAMAGPEPRNTVDWFFRKQFDKNFKMIKGNTDLMLAQYSNEVFENVKLKAPIMAEALRNDYSALNPVQRDFLNSLPEYLELEIEGVKFLLVHGSPRKNDENIFPDTPLGEIEKMLENVQADVVLCGHTHIPCGFQTASKKTVVNVGSVGRPFTEDARSSYLIINVQKGKCVFEHRSIKYDNEVASLKLKRRNFSGAEKLAEMLINPSVRHM